MNWFANFSKTESFTYGFVFDGFDPDGLYPSAMPDVESINLEIESRNTHTKDDRWLS